MHHNIRQYLLNEYGYNDSSAATTKRKHTKNEECVHRRSGRVRYNKTCSENSFISESFGIYNKVGQGWGFTRGYGADSTHFWQQVLGIARHRNPRR
jgi:hypothetical protein